MTRGRISRLQKGRGIGFIEAYDVPSEVEFHWSSVTAGDLEQLAPGQEVEFETKPHPRENGRNIAVEVRLLV